MSSNFEMFAGDTRDIIVTVKDQDGVEVDLAGGTVLWKMATKDWKKTEDAAVLITKDSGAGQILIDAAVFTVRLLSADTEGLEGSYYHEAQVTLADGTVGTPMTGTIKIKPNIIIPR